MAFMDQFQQQPQSMQQPMPSPDVLRERIQTFRQIMQGNPRAVIGELQRSNPDFARFMAENSGKTPQQFLAERGMDLGQILGLL